MKTGHEQLGVPLPIIALRLRALVLALGESADPAWWKTEIMNEAGLRFLERLYPRTFLHAAVHAAGKAASDTHDRAVGRVGVYHLFRLPESLELEICRTPLASSQDFLLALREALNRPEKLMELLAPLCNEEEADSVSGAKKIGTHKEVITAAGLRRTAAAYRQAFARKKSVFPYFTADLGEGEE